MVAHFKLRTYDVNKVFFRKKRIWWLFRCNQMPSTNRNAWFTPYISTWHSEMSNHLNKNHGIHPQAAPGYWFNIYQSIPDMWNENLGLKKMLNLKHKKAAHFLGHLKIFGYVHIFKLVLFIYIYVYIDFVYLHTL